jgi:hypothetical protein
VTPAATSSTVEIEIALETLDAILNCVARADKKRTGVDLPAARRFDRTDQPAW